MLIDTHAHINFKAFETDFSEVIQRAFDNDIFVINVGTQLDTSTEAVMLAKQYPKQAFAVVGLHPVHTYSQHLDEEESSFKTREEVFDYNQYQKLAENPEVVGIGECGLDYFRLNVEDTRYKIEDIKQMQKNAFIKQIQLAKELNKALVIHSRSSPGTDDACLEILEILKTEGVSQLRFVLHSYTGSPEVAKQFVALGAYISFNGIITFDKTGNQAAVLQVVPNDRIVLETDCPYLTPVPMRGKRNESLFVKYVAVKVAELKNQSVDAVEILTTQNAKRLFNI